MMISTKYDESRNLYINFNTFEENLQYDNVVRPLDNNIIIQNWIAVGDGRFWS